MGQITKKVSMEKLKKIGKVVIPFAMTTLPFLALAALLPPTNPLGGTGLTLTEADALIQTIGRFVIGVSIVIAIIFIVIGVILRASAGTNTGMLDKGKAYIKNGIIGALIVFLIGVILQTISNLVARTFFS